MNPTGSWLAENGSKLALVIGSRIVLVLGFQQSSENVEVEEKEQCTVCDPYFGGLYKISQIYGHC